METLRFAGSNNDIPRPNPVDIPPSLSREVPINIAVISSGAITPLGNSVPATWESYLAGRSGIVENRYSPFTEPTYDGDGKGIEPQIRATTAGTIKGFNPKELLVDTRILPRKEVIFKLGDFAQYNLAAVHEAMQVKTEDGIPLLIPRLNQDGSLNKERQWIINPKLINPLHFTVAFASGFGGGDESVKVMDLLRHPDHLIPSGDNMMRSLLDRAASTITQAYGLNGGAEGYVAACASFGKAMVAAVNKIAMGRAEAALVSAAEGVLWMANAAAMFDAYGALDPGTNPLSVSRSLHKIRRGFTIAEGAIAFLIADYNWAKQNKLPILCRIIGYGETSGAGHNTDPNGPAQEQSMRLAMRGAERYGPVEEWIVNSGHYTGTHAGDLSEVLHTQNVLELYKKITAIFASKRLSGHMLGPAGGLSMLVAVLMLQKGIVPGMQFDGEMMDEAYGWNIFRETKPVPFTDALVNMFGFGDANDSLWLRKD